jgi:hypothetical protein
LSKKKLQSERVAAIIAKYGPTQEAEAVMVKRLKINPNTAGFYCWRHKRTGTVSKSPARKKSTKRLKGATARKKKGGKKQ